MNTFYDIGVELALSDAGLIKSASVLTRAATQIARMKAVGRAKAEAREALGLPTPEWRQKSVLDIPEEAAKALGIIPVEVEEETPVPISTLGPPVEAAPKPKKKPSEEKPPEEKKE